MSTQEFQYRVKAKVGPDDITESYAAPDDPYDPKEAGDFYRWARGLAEASSNGGEVELQRRPMGDWETVERAVVEPKPDNGV
jgi:hypothetical protein